MPSFKKLEQKRIELRAMLSDLMLSTDINKKTATKIRDDIKIADDGRTFNKIKNLIKNLTGTKAKTIKEMKKRKTEEQRIEQAYERTKKAIEQDINIINTKPELIKEEELNKKVEKKLIMDKSKHFLVTAILYKQMNEEGYKVTKQQDRKENIKRRWRYFIQDDKKVYLEQISYRSYDCEKCFFNFEKCKKSYIWKKDINFQPCLVEISKALNNNDEEHYEDYFFTLSSYVDCVYIVSCEEVNEETEEEDYIEHVKNKKRKNGTKKFICSKYTSYQIDASATNIMNYLKNDTSNIENECMLNAFLRNYDGFFNKKGRKSMTRADLLRIMNKTEDDIKQGVSVSDMDKVFQEYGINVRCYNEFSTKPIITYDYDVEKKKKALYILLKDDHCYLYTDVDSLKQKSKDDDNLIVSKNFPIMEELKDDKYFMVSSIEEIKTLINQESKRINIVHRESDLASVYVELKEKMNYEPNIRVTAGKITSMLINLGEKEIIIKSQDINPYDSDLVLTDEAIYNKYRSTYNELYKDMFQEADKSAYSELCKNILKEYHTLAINGQLIRKKNTSDNIDYVEIDVTKAFSYACEQIKKLPKFIESDIWQPYDGHKVESCTLYLIESQNKISHTSTKVLLYGQFMTGEEKIIGFQRPSTLKKCNYKQLIQNVYKTDLCTFVKKMCCNVAIGMMEKQKNKKSRSYTFENVNEAVLAQIKYGGKLTVHYPMNKYEINQKSDLDIEDEDNITSYVDEIDNTKPIYILTISKEEDLINGFRHVKELLLQLHNHKMQQAYDLLKLNNIKVYAVKTDCFIIESSDLAKAQTLLNFGASNGDWRIGRSGLDVFQDGQAFERKECKEIIIPEIKPMKKINITNEYDTQAIIKQINENKRTLIKAEYAGSGKSYIAQKMNKVLIVCPTNCLAQKFNKDGQEAVTINKFFGFGVSKFDMVAKFDDSDFETICFDEMYMYSIQNMIKVLKYAQAHPEKAIVATGDLNQLPPIEMSVNNVKYYDYVDFIMSQIFSHYIKLEIPKRYKTEADKQKVINFKLDIFNESIPIKNTINKYFKYTKTINTISNIAYFNDTCKDVSKVVRGSGDYEVGETLICRKHHDCGKNKKLYVNYEYDVFGVKKNQISLTDADGEIYTLSREVVESDFIFNHCGTAHSYQGRSVEENEITIFDWKAPIVSRQWIYTAVTRCRTMEGVQFFDYTSDNKYEIVKTYLQKKIDGYKKQDKDKKRNIDDDDYVDIEFLLSACGNSCASCGEYFWIGTHSSNITCQRVNNNLSHTKNNCIFYCTHCNISAH